MAARKLVIAILRMAKKAGFNYDSDIALIHDGTGRRYVRRIVRKDPEPKKPKKMSFADFVKDYEKRR